MRFEHLNKATTGQNESHVPSANTFERRNASDTVYLLWFVHEGEAGEEEALLIGVYANESEAKAAIERLRNKNGFCEYVEGFQIHPTKLVETIGQKASYAASLLTACKITSGNNLLTF